MANKKTKHFATLLFGLTLSSGYAQQAATATGGVASGIGGSATYSAGQIVYTTNTGISGSVAQGVQQPYEISIPQGLEQTGIQLIADAYPNPTSGSFILRVKTFDKQMAYQLYEGNGLLLENKKITDATTSIHLENLAAGVYLLIVNNEFKELKTFKITKN